MVSQKHIAICSTSFYEYDRRLQRIAKTLYENGYKISWLSRRKDINSLPLPYVTHHFIKTKNPRGPLFYKQYNKQLKAALLKHKPDLINCIDLDTVIGCYDAQKKLKCLITYDAHEIYYEVPELLGKPIKKSIWKVIARKYLPTIKNNYTVNSSLKQHYEKKYGQVYEVIRNVPSIEQTKSQSNKAKTKTNNKTLLYLGVLNKGRGIEIAIEAMRQLPTYRLLLIGEGDHSESLRYLAKGLSNVEFLGFRKPNELPALLDKASIGLNILQAESLNYKLSLANKFFDYMHAGLPSINMAYPEYQHILKKDQVGILIDKYESSALISALQSLEVDTLFQKISATTITSRDKYTWEKESKKLIALYANLLQ